MTESAPTKEHPPGTASTEDRPTLIVRLGRVVDHEKEPLLDSYLGHQPARRRDQITGPSPRRKIGKPLGKFRNDRS